MDYQIWEPRLEVEFSRGAFRKTSHFVPPPQMPATTTSMPEIPGYRLVKVEGKGPVGTVYRARSEKHDTLVAVKRVSRQLTAHKTFLSYLQDGIQRLSKASDANLARPLRLGRAGESYFVVSEFVEGECLRDRLRQTGRLPETEARSFVLQAARGLDCACRAGVLHYDLKPANILLSQDDEVKVTDFWLNFHRYVGSAPEEQLFEMMEFPLYMSPEERNDETVTARSNVFSLGAMLHHMVYGKPLLNVHGERAPAPALPEGVTISDETRRLIARMTAEDPKDRYADCGEVVEALEGSSLKKIDPAEIGLYGGVVLAVVLTAFIFLRGARAPGAPDDHGPPGAGNQTAIGTNTSVDSGPKAQLQEIEAFLFQHPDRVDEAIRRFEAVAQEHQGTLWETSGQERVLSLRRQRTEEEQKQWAQAERDLERLCKQESYAQALKLVEQFSKGTSADELKEKAGAVLAVLREKEKASYDGVRGRVAEQAANRDFARARRELEHVIAHFTRPDILESAKTELTLVGRMEGSASEVKPAELEVDGSAEEESFRKFVGQVSESAACFRYLQAEHLCRQAMARFNDEEMRAFARACSDTIPADQKFAKALFDRINSRKGQAPTIHTRDRKRLRVYWADWDGVTVSPSGGEKWGWKQFDAEEIFRMLDQKIDRQNGPDQLGMARFCGLRGLWLPRSQKLRLAVAFDPALKSEAKRFEFSDRLRILLERGE